MTPDLYRFTQLARSSPKQQFNSVMGLLCREEGLTDSFGRLAKNKAPGVDGMRKADYEVGLGDRLADLSARLRRSGYRPQPVRRVYIPKASGNGHRPLGIPALEDRIVQDRASQILQAIWEPEFLDCSFGFRPGKSAHDALRRVDQIVMRERTQWCVEADIKGFFNHVDHRWLVRFLEHRIADKRFVRSIQRFLKAGVMEDGAVSASEQGTPQGGLVTPLTQLTTTVARRANGQARFTARCRCWARRKAFDLWKPVNDVGAF
ncbi:MAG TPA: reverse transcriptase domain-containing protein, partial [Myxococcota bacterium]|nr:reverse transcriptase domain-containing protein [Myxococcota bacterium]